MKPAADERREEPSASVVVTTEVGSIARVFDEAINVVVLERTLTTEVGSAARALLSVNGLELKLAIPPDARGREQLAGRLESRALVDDVMFWAGVIADLTGAVMIGIRLARHDAAMCPRFHVDRVLVRLCTTYCGSGTEYLADADADRGRLGFAAGGQPDETSGLLREGATIRRASTGAVVVLKGEAWSGNEGRGAIHRSPATSSDAPRLILTLDALG
jgi:hypothetical protein